MEAEFDYGSFAKDWMRDNQVLGLMEKRVTKLIEAKVRGACVLPAELDDGLREWLETSRRRLRCLAGGFPNLESNLALRDLFKVPLGLVGPTMAIGDRSFIAEQALSLRPRHWADPVTAVLHAAVQVAAHHAILDGADKKEDSLTEVLVARLLDFLAGEVLPAFVLSETRLPPGKTIDFASASMQTKRGDALDSDLAIVVGTRICGAPRYRVVIMQAKRSETGFRADVSYKSGKQLDGVLSTGMGYYLFYPPDRTDVAVPPTVRDANAVFAEAREGTYPRFKSVAAINRSAWDFGAFVGVALFSPRPVYGRIFATERQVAAALLGLRKRPLDVLMLSDSTDARIWTLVSRLRDADYAVAGVESMADAIARALDGASEPAP